MVALQTFTVDDPASVSVLEPRVPNEEQVRRAKCADKKLIRFAWHVKRSQVKFPRAYVEADTVPVIVGGAKPGIGGMIDGRLGKVKRSAQSSGKAAEPTNQWGCKAYLGGC